MNPLGEYKNVNSVISLLDELYEYFSDFADVEIDYDQRQIPNKEAVLMDSVDRLKKDIEVYNDIRKQHNTI